MNSESAGQALALKGRVPIRIIGPITKGDYVYADADGVAHNSPIDSNIVGIALESSDVESEKLVECVLKV
jgi:regulator of RNase E activity RraA